MAFLDCDGQSLIPGVHDLVLANPPYYSNHRIDALFVVVAERALTPSGWLLLVTKFPKWFEERLDAGFSDLQARQVGHYVVVAGKRR